MYSLSMPGKRRWRISKGRLILLSGIGTAQEAIAIARSHGILLSKFYNFNQLESVA